MTQYKTSGTDQESVKFRTVGKYYRTRPLASFMWKIKSFIVLLSSSFSVLHVG
jgi:hypothetical protein